jgi:hypothetical protein
MQFSRFAVCNFYYYSLLSLMFIKLSWFCFLLFFFFAKWNYIETNLHACCSISGFLFVCTIDQEKYIGQTTWLSVCESFRTNKMSKWSIEKVKSYLLEWHEYIMSATLFFLNWFSGHFRKLYWIKNRFFEIKTVFSSLVTSFSGLLILLMKLIWL